MPQHLTGQIGLVFQPQNFIERVICWGTKADTYHAVLAVSETEAVSAEPHGAVIRPLDAFPHTVWSNFALTDGQRFNIVRWGRKFVGVPYNFADAIALGLGRKFGYEAPDWVKRRLSTDSRLLCSQLVDSAYEHAGVHLFADGRLPGDVTPGDLEIIWKRRGWL